MPRDLITLGTGTSIRGFHAYQQGSQEKASSLGKGAAWLAKCNLGFCSVYSTHLHRDTHTMSHNVQGRSVTDVLPLLFGDQQHSLQEVAHSVAALSIQGYIAVPPATFGHKHKQYLYINNRYVRAGQIGKLINSLFRSVMLKLEQADEHQRKASQQYPAFALQIACPASSYDITSDPDKAHIEFADWPAVLSAVQAAVLDAWHTVVGDKMLSELLDNPFCAARAHSQLPVAA